MKPNEYEEWKNDSRVGKCPYCSKPGWIVGDSDWCEHYIGTTEMFGGEPFLFSFLSEEPYLEFLQIIERIRSFDESKIASLFNLLTKEEKEILTSAIENGNRFTEDILPYERLNVVVEETLFETTYFSYFLKNPDEQIVRLSENIRVLMTKLRRIIEDS